MLLSVRPAPPLADYVEALWGVDEAQPLPGPERVLPNGRFQLVINLSAGSGAVTGMRSQSVAIDTGLIRSAVGVLFRPGGARAFFEHPAGDFFNRIVPLDAVWGPRAAELHARLCDATTARARLHVLDAALAAAVHNAPRAKLALHSAVKHALYDFRRVPAIESVAAVARDAGLSRRRLTELFDQQVGITPKLYCRVARFRAVVRQIAAGAEVDWAEVALAAGYYDQAHLAHEFRDFSGMSPGSYLAAERPSLNHVRVEKIV